jgi:WD40 repeat protein
VVLALDKSKSIQSFQIDPTSSNFTRGRISIPNAMKYTVDKVRMAPDGSWVAVLGDETYVKVFHLDGTLLFAKDTRQMANTELSVSSNSELVAASSFTSDVVVYGIDRDRSDIPRKVQKAFVIGQHENSISTIDFDPKTLRLATGGKDRKYNVWLSPIRWREGDVAKLEWSGSVDAAIDKIRICPGGEIIAVLTVNGILRMIGKNGVVKELKTVHSSVVSHMEWSPDGKWIVVASMKSPFLYGYSKS